MPFLLALDVGNTQISLGAFQGKKLLRQGGLPTHPLIGSDKLGAQLRRWLRQARLNPAGVGGIIIASVVPPRDAGLARACLTAFHRRPLWIGPKIKLGIANRYKNPREVGADRLVNAVAVHALLGGPAIVVDFGTATTFDCVSSKGEYLGGVIAPGLQIAQDALADRTAKLPRITFEVPGRVMGRTTKESLQSGLFFGYIALVEGILQRLIKELSGKPQVIATGGLATVIGSRVRLIQRIMPALTLEGLRIIWERNE